MSKLSQPLAPVGDAQIRVFALGGIGEIGRNMTVLETSAGLLLIDCGLLFPSGDAPGVDFILPDLSPIEDSLDSVVGLVLTHGHEDHIGGVPHLLRLRPDIPVFGTRFTLALVAFKLVEHRLKATLNEIREGDQIKLGPYSVEFHAVNHSVPDGVALSIEANGLRILHTGDFKLDQQPIDGRLTDLAGFGRMGLLGVDLLMSDSTNADVPGHLPDEVDVAPNFVRIFEEAPGLVVVACFASHVHRVQQVIKCAHEVGKRVALVGRSMERNMRLAQQVGLLDIPDSILVPPNEIHLVERSSLVIACTGSQGEPMAVLSRLARDEHRIRVDEGDIVILSARLIPGNETDVFRVINGLSERGVNVLHGGIANIHASGHAPAGELRQVLNLVKPRYLLPVHGEWRHLRAHAAIARSVGISSDRVIFAPNGTVVDLDSESAQVVGRIDVESVMVDTTGRGHIDDDLLRDRRLMGLSGILLVTVEIRRSNGTMVAISRTSMRGLRRDDRFLTRVDEITREVCNELVASNPGLLDHEQIESRIARRIFRWLRSARRRVPAIHVTVSVCDDSATILARPPAHENRKSLD